MRFSRWLVLPVAAPLLLAGCGRFGEAMTAHTDTVARAAGKELKVDEAARLLAANPQIPADPQVVRALADYWVDYTLLAQAVAQDTTLSAIDLDAFTKSMREQMVLQKLQQKVIRADTVVTDEQMRQRWVTEGPGVELNARHILLRVPAEATPAQRDSVKAQAEQLRQQAAGGADFAQLATRFSQDPGSAQQGGQLPPFGRGRMVAQFEEAAFKLQAGQVSPVVETPFGYHVIKVEGRQQPELKTEEIPQFRQFLIQQARRRADSVYIDSVSKAAKLAVRPGAAAVVREIARRPELNLKGRAANREIVTYDRGAYTAGEFAQFARSQGPEMQSQISAATDEQLEQAVQQLARGEVLLAQARAQGIALTKQEEDQIRAQARQGITGLIQATGLTRLGGRGGNTAAAQEAAVKQLLEGLVTQQQQLPPLGPLGFALRDLYGAEVNEGTFAQVVKKLEQLRASQPATTQLPGGMPQPGQMPQGQMPPGQMPQGQMPQGQMPQGQMPPQGEQPITPPDTGR